MMRATTVCGLGAVAFMATALLASSPAAAQQRLSLAERVQRLEQQAERPAAESGFDQVNQMQVLQSQVQELQGRIEVLQHELEQARRRNQAQYVDLDSRIVRLEGGEPVAATLPEDAADESAAISEIELAPASPPAGASADETAAPPLMTAAGPIPGDSVDPEAEKTSYDEAFTALKDGRYAESARRFQAFLTQYPNAELAGNAAYWLGESYYVTQNYRIALQSFEDLMRRYPSNQKAPDALLKIGYCHYEMKQWSRAESTLTQVMQDYPDTTVARLAEGRLRALKLERR